MASAANSSAAAYEGTSYGGAGGKFKKRPFRRTQTTPYDRPATSLRPTQLAAANNNNDGWLKKIVDPAHKLITAGAHKLFSSVFRKRLLPPPPPSPPPQQQHPSPQQRQHFPDEREEIEDMQPEAATIVVTPATEEPFDCGGNDTSRPSGSNRVADLEDILKQKTFTRSEVDHLTALLLSRTADSSVGAEKGRSDPKFLDLELVPHRHEKLSNSPAYENRIEHAVPSAISTPEVRSKVFPDVVSSPAELAKAYMGSRPTSVSSSALGLQNQIPKEDFTPRSPAISIFEKPASEIVTSKNGFMTPRFRGRSAIYSMARTPYSRVHPAISFKVAETNYNVGGGSSSSLKTMDSDQLNGSKRQVLKRRSTVLENDIGSTGPIRRIRQKPNLLHPKTLSLPSSGSHQATHVSGVNSDVTEVPSAMGWNSHNRSLSKVPADDSLPSTISGYVPSQSIETAQKIFEQLDKFAPKGKSPEKKINIGVEKTPTKMTPVMLDGLAHKSMETLDSVNVLPSIQDSTKVNGSLDSVNLHNHLPTTTPMLEEAFGKKFVSSSDNQASQNGEEARNIASDLSFKSKAADYVIPLSSLDHSRKKRAFQMSAHEDYLELDDDVPSNGEVASNSLTKGSEPAELSRKPVTTPDILLRNETIALEKTPAPEPKPSTISVLGKEPESASDGPAASESTAYLFSHVVPSSPPPTSMNKQDPGSAPQTTESDKVASQNEKKKMFSAFSFKSDNQLPPVSFVTSPAVVASTVPKENKLGFPSANDSAAAANGSDKTLNKSTQLTADGFKESEHSPSVLMSAKGTVTFGLPADSAAPSGPKLANGSVESTPNSAAAAAGVVISTATTNSMTAFSVSTSHLSSSVTAPSLFSRSGFQLGSLAMPSTSETVATSGSEFTANSGSKLNDITFPKTTSSLFCAKPSATSSEGNSSSTISSTSMKSASGEAQTAGSGGSNEFKFAFQASSSAASLSTLAPSFSGQSASSISADVSTLAPSFPSQPAPSFSASAFGMSGSSSFGSSGSVLASLTAPASPFSSGNGTALSASGSCSTSSSVSTSGTTASNIFGSSWQSPKATTPAITTPTPLTGFSFGASSAAAINSPFVFGGVTTTSSATGNSTPFAFGSGPAASAPVFSVPSSAISTAPSSSSIFQSQHTFGNGSPQLFAFGSTPSGNNDQMSMEDSMAEDSVQPSTPAGPVFNAPVSAPSSSFVFGGAAPAPSIGSPFQFSGNQNQIAPQNPSPFASGSLEFNAGGASSFSLGTGGDKSGRRIVKAKRTGARRK